MTNILASTDRCFWCDGPMRGAKGITTQVEKRSVTSCIECAVDAGSAMHAEGLARRFAIELELCDLGCCA